MSLGLTHRTRHRAAFESKSESKSESESESDPLPGRRTVPDRSLICPSRLRSFSSSSAFRASSRCFLKRVSVMGRKKVQSKPYCLQC